MEAGSWHHNAVIYAVDVETFYDAAGELSVDLDRYGYGWFRIHAGETDRGDGPTQ